MARRDDDFNSTQDKKFQAQAQVTSAPPPAQPTSFLQRIKLQATNSLEILPKSFFPTGAAPVTPPAPQQAPLSTEEGLRKGLIVLGPESTFASKPYNKYNNEIDEKTLSAAGVPCMRSDSLTSSELGLSRSGRPHCSRRWCLGLVLAVLVIALGAAAGIYFAYQFLGLESEIEKVFRGKMRVTGVDTSVTTLTSGGFRKDYLQERPRDGRRLNKVSRMSVNRSGHSRNRTQGTGVRRRIYHEDHREMEAPWHEGLTDTSSQEYRDTMRAFKKRMDHVYSTSLLRKAFIRSEILGLDRGDEDSLIVHFDIHTDIETVHVDAADVYLIILSEIRNSNSEPFAGLMLDEESVEIEERKRSPIQTTSTHPTELSYSEQQTQGTSSLNMPSPSTSHASYYNANYRNNNNNKNSSPVNSSSRNRSNNYFSRLSTQSSGIFATPEPRLCTKLDLSFCAALHHNVTTYPNLMGHTNIDDVEKDLLAIREVIDSECHPLALEFMCEVLQPDCHKYTQPTPRGTFEDELIPPCRDFCEEVMGACRTRLPRHLRLKIDCGKFPLFQDGRKCTAKPGCSRELRLKGWPTRVCDGVVDCLDMSDEDHCSSCTPGSFRCGGGAQCVPQDRKCDGVEDCLNGSDERSCLSLTSTPTDESSLKDQRWIRYNREGLLRYTEAGLPSRVCVDNINKTLTTREATELIHNMAEVTCDLLTYGGVDLVEVVVEDGFDHVPGLGYVQISDVHKSNITFEPVNCTRRTVVYMACSELACGVRPLYLHGREPVYTDRVARTAGAGDWPWAAALLKDGVHTCDATLVHPTWLLTTANCFQGHGRALWVARMGSVRISSQAPWVQERLIVGMVKSAVKDSQMVLVKLEEEVQLSDYVRPVCLGSHNNATQLYSRTCRALGWGNRRDPLIELRGEVVSGNNCSAIARTTQHRTAVSPNSRDLLCAQQKFSTNSCLLEELSGAGLLCEWAGRWEVVGVAISATGCKEGTRPRIYDDVSPAAVKWIKVTIAAFAEKTY